MAEDNQLTVAIHRSGGVSIGIEPTGPSAYYFPAFGAMIGIDLMDPSSQLYVLVSDYARAAWWLSNVYDDAVTQAVRTLWPAEDPDESGLDSPASVVLSENRGWLWNAVYRYGTGCWLQHFWPSHDAWEVAPGTSAPRINEALIDLEVGVSAWACQFVLGGLASARLYLQGHEQDLLALARSGRGDSGLVVPALRATIEAVPLPDAVLDDLRAQESIEDAVAIAIPSDDDLAEALSPPMLVQTRGLSTGDAELRFDVDPRQLPGRALSSAPGAVQLDLAPEPGGIRAFVTVAAGDRSTDEVIWTMVYHGGGRPIATFPLAHDPNASVYAASAMLEVDTEPIRRDRLYVRVGTADRLASPDPGLISELREATMPIFRIFLERSRVEPERDVPVQDLDPTAAWRALTPSAMS